MTTEFHFVSAAFRFAFERRLGCRVEFRRHSDRLTDFRAVEVHRTDGGRAHETWLGGGDTHDAALSDAGERLTSRRKRCVLRIPSHLLEELLP